MRRGLVLGLAVLGLAACGQGEQKAAETADVGAPGTSPYVATCIEMTAAENWGEASRLCAMALNADPGNEAVKKALATANAALASEPDLGTDADSPTSGEAAGEAADDAAEAAQEAGDAPVH
jgi:hypothetical protein